jgi:transcriptional regulator with PAS, ATPase and Fis domain
MRSLIGRIAKANVNTLITGETGVGKELVAKHLYHKSNRDGKPFIKINCAALPDTLIESELFGYKKGAYTGADREGKGKFELANGGVLFLDEIGEMATDLQAKILHVLQDGFFTPIGASECVQSDVWCIAATNRNIQAELEIGNFRQDLYYRLSAVGLHIEPLRKRPEDVIPLLNYFLEKYSKELDSGESPALSDNLLERVHYHKWPGNVRELQNFVKRYILLGENEVDLPNPETDSFINAIGSEQNNYHAKPLDVDNINLKNMARKAKDREEKRIISYVLNKTEWNKSTAAKILKISYKTLLYKIDDFKIHPKKINDIKVIGFPKSNYLEHPNSELVREIHI